jgi:hypothetical protein
MRIRFGSFVMLTMATLGFINDPIFAQSVEQKALSLAVEQNLEIRRFHDECMKDGTSIFPRKDAVTASVILVPINKEVLDASIAYKAKLDGLSGSATKALEVQCYATYLNGPNAAFVLFVKTNDDLDQDDDVHFVNFGESVFLHDETRKYILEKYTRVFDEKLSPGWNRGYLYFQNFRKSKDYSYSVHFSGFVVNACASVGVHSARPESWAMSFDEAYMKFFSLLQEGLSENSIRQKYGITSYTTAGFSGKDILDIINTVVGILSLLK